MKYWSNVYYYGARYYDPRISVWLGVDPLADSFPSWSPYKYCMDNPVNHTDQTGMFEDGFIEYWNSKTQTYDEVKVNDKGGKETDYKEFRGGPKDGLMQTVNKQTLKSTWTDISTWEISPVTGGPTGRGALKDANWIIYLAVGVVTGNNLLISMAKKGIRFPGNDPGKAPAGYEWRGKPGSEPGSAQGNWYNPKTNESLRPDLNHSKPIGPHWDYRDASGKWWRIFPDGRNMPK